MADNTQVASAGADTAGTGSTEGNPAQPGADRADFDYEKGYVHSQQQISKLGEGRKSLEAENAKLKAEADFYKDQARMKAAQAQQQAQPTPTVQDIWKQWDDGEITEVKDLVASALTVHEQQVIKAVKEDLNQQKYQGTVEDWFVKHPDAQSFFQSEDFQARQAANPLMNEVGIYEAWKRDEELLKRDEEMQILKQQATSAIGTATENATERAVALAAGAEVAGQEPGPGGSMRDSQTPKRGELSQQQLVDKYVGKIKTGKYKPK